MWKCARSAPCGTGRRLRRIVRFRLLHRAGNAGNWAERSGCATVLAALGMFDSGCLRAIIRRTLRRRSRNVWFARIMKKRNGRQQAEEQWAVGRTTNDQ